MKTSFLSQPNLSFFTSEYDFKFGFLWLSPYTLKQLKDSSFTTQNSAIPESFGGPNSFKTFPTVELRIYEASLIFITE